MPSTRPLACTLQEAHLGLGTIVQEVSYLILHQRKRCGFSCQLTRGGRIGHMSHANNIEGGKQRSPRGAFQHVWYEACNCKGHVHYGGIFIAE